MISFKKGCLEKKGSLLVYFDLSKLNLLRNRGKQFEQALSFCRSI